mmetsp:Transcript_46347/g.142990  ORF Transcript_46347/g.142990 Transcript_46347/m.142990 type:complete len:228 (+) Transcript_46347:1559-2242(+)
MSSGMARRTAWMRSTNARTYSSPPHARYAARMRCGIDGESSVKHATRSPSGSAHRCWYWCGSSVAHAAAGPAASRRSSPGTPPPALRCHGFAMSSRESNSLNWHTAPTHFGAPSPDGVGADGGTAGASCGLLGALSASSMSIPPPRPICPSGELANRPFAFPLASSKALLTLPKRLSLSLMSSSSSTVAPLAATRLLFSPSTWLFASLIPSPKCVVGVFPTTALYSG